LPAWSIIVVVIKIVKSRFAFFLALVFCILTGILFQTNHVYADTSSINQLTNQIQQLQNQLNAAKNQEKTLNSQLQYIDNQTKLTELKIEDTQYQVTKLDKEINDLGTYITNLSTKSDQLTKVLLDRIVTTYKYSNFSPLDLIFSARGFADLLERIKYIQIIQSNDKKVLYNLQATKSTYNDQQTDKKTRQEAQQKLQKDLKNYQVQLASQKKSKQDLLDATKGNEATYQRLIAQAKAQLTAFARFTSGKASLLSNQTVCDSWGCYYNQRDSKWGNIGLNRTSYSLADYGCLITSVAMVYTHYGYKDVTPAVINADPDNFASYYPTYLKYTISADGVNSTRANTIIDSELKAGRPVIVGVSYDGGPVPDHFVVLISGSNGNYQMNDPFTANGHNIPFTSHYSVASIKEINKVIF
jgi:peptidoglycan hydrolase CwlO-like protein